MDEASTNQLMVYYNRYQERYGQDEQDSTNGNSTHGHDDHMEGDHHEQEGMSFSLDGVGTVTIDYDDAGKYLALGAASAAAIALTL